MTSFDPLSSLLLIVLQISNKYMKLDITKAQEKIFFHPFTQTIMYFSVIYFTTRNVPLSLFIVLLTYILLYVLLNENHKYNILPKIWLYENKIISKYESDKEKYIENLNKYHF